MTVSKMVQVLNENVEEIGRQMERHDSWYEMIDDLFLHHSFVSSPYSPYSRHFRALHYLHHPPVYSPGFTLPEDIAPEPKRYNGSNGLISDSLRRSSIGNSSEHEDEDDPFWMVLQRTLRLFPDLVIDEETGIVRDKMKENEKKGRVKCKDSDRGHESDTLLAFVCLEPEEQSLISLAPSFQIPDTLFDCIFRFFSIRVFDRFVFSFFSIPCSFVSDQKNNN